MKLRSGKTYHYKYIRTKKKVRKRIPKHTDFCCICCEKYKKGDYITSCKDSNLKKTYLSSCLYTRGYANLY